MVPSRASLSGWRRARLLGPERDLKQRNTPVTLYHSKGYKMASSPSPATELEQPSKGSKLLHLPQSLQHVHIESLRPYERNPRTHSPEQIAKIAVSLLEYGWTNPILVDGESGIIAGHGRLLAARELGMETVPVIELSHLTEAQKRAYVIADNRLALDAGWDEELLGEELKALEEDDFDLALTGFELDELYALLEDEDVEDTPAPEPPDVPVTQPGDLWILGNHRLLCGDSADNKTVDRLMAGATIHLVNMDPPYNVKVEPRSSTAIAAGLSSHPDLSKKMHHQGFDVARGATDPTKAKKKIRAKDRPLFNDFVTDEAFDEMLLAWFANASRVLMPGGAFYIWGGYANLGNYPAPLNAAGLYFSQGIVWDKMHPVLTRKDYMGAFELCFYGWKEGAAHRYFGPANKTDLWHVKKVNPQAMVHLTEKPVELAVQAIQYSSRPGEKVLDLFGGSGSTLIGAEQTGRRCYMMELDPAYCDVIVQRWQMVTGQEALLDGDSGSFETVRAERQAATEA